MNGSMSGFNKGEWSEIFALLKTLESFDIEVVDGNLSRTGNRLKISGVAKTVGKDVFQFLDSERSVRVFKNGAETSEIEKSELSKTLSYFYGKIMEGDKSFQIPEVEEFLERIFGKTRFKSQSTEKADMKLVYEDPFSGTVIEGVSIKSSLVDAGSLLNASKSTNFVYEVFGLDGRAVSEVNAIDGRAKISDRMRRIRELGGNLSFAGVWSRVFEENLRKIDSNMPEILADALLKFYYEKTSRCSKLGHEMKIKALLDALAVGMFPSKPFNLDNDTNGGYVIVYPDGNLALLSTRNREEFKDYLYRNTKLETPSSTKHRFGKLIPNGGRVFFALNLQIRFVMNEIT